MQAVPDFSTPNSEVVSNSTGNDETPIRLVRPERPRLSFFRQIGRSVRRFWDDLKSQFSNDPLERCRWVRFPSTLKSVSNKTKDQLARAGEEEVVIMLQEKGYLILHRNIRFPEGELDIVARDGETLVFLEIKTRRRKDAGRPYEAVKAAKQRRQVALARRFQQLCGVQNVPVRFDIVSVIWPEDGPPEFEHLSDAFRSNDFRTK